MRFALVRFAPAEHAWAANQFAKWDAAGESEAFSSPRIILWGCLCERLQRGELVAYGVPRGARVPERIEPHFFRRANFDLDSDRIDLDGEIYNGVEIFEAKDDLSTPPAAFVKPPYSAPALRAWFALRVGIWPPGAAAPTEEADFLAAKAAFDSVPRDEFRAIRREKVPESWRKPGPGRK